METCDVGAVLSLIYKARVNLRIQNHSGTGFYGRVSNDQIFYRGLTLQDFMQPRKYVYRVSRSSILEMNKWYFSKSLGQLCRFLFKEVSNEIPQILEYIESEDPSGVEDILGEAHKKGYQFIIESVWDFGYDVFLLRKTDDVYELRKFNSDEITEIAEWIDLEMNLCARNSGHALGSQKLLTPKEKPLK